MTTDFNGIVSSGGFKASTKNTPIDVRTRIESLSEIELIPNPFVGMIFYVLEEEKFYVVKTLKAKSLGTMTIEDALIDKFELLINDVNLDGIATEEFVKELITQIELVPGPQGPAGEQGLPGKDGENGKDGIDGKDGKDFTYDMFTPEQLEALRGPQGEQGPAGKDGKDAEPVDLTGYATEEFVQDAIKNIQVGDGVDLSHLATKEEVEKLHQRKYEVSGVPEGTLVKYFDNEVRVMCPKDAEFHKQNVGAGGLSNRYYMNFTMFAPEGAVTFREGTQGMTAAELVLEDELRTVVDGKRTIWLSLAVLDEATGEWTYRGDESTVDRCIGWNVLVEWYDAEGKVIIRDSFRVNIANEKCFDSVVPLYREGLANKAFVKEQIENIELKDGAQGPAGQDGVSVVNVTIEGNRLKVELSNGQILDAGELPAGQGGGGAVNPELEKELAETKQQLLDLTYGVEYEYIYFDVQDAAAETDLKFDPVTAPKFFEEYNAAIDAGQDEDFIMSMYEQDIYRMYILRVASDHRTMNRYEMIPIEDSEVQPKNDYIPSWNAVKNVSSWNWTGDTDGGFTINQGPTSAMVFAFMKVKEEYRGKF